MIEPVPAARVHPCSGAPIRPGRRYVLYWMIAARRPDHSFSLQRAARHAEELGLPLVVFEGLRVAHPWATERTHRFVVDGMACQAEAFSRRIGVRYHPWLETAPGQGRGLLAALAAEAAVVVTDHFPAYFLPRMVQAAAGQLDVLLERVDSTGILPLAEAGRAFPTAYGFRRHLHRELRPHLAALPMADPLAGADLPAAVALPEAVLRRWPAVDPSDPRVLGTLPIDRTVGAVAERGGAVAARARLGRFLDRAVDRYHRDARHPDLHATSGLSPWLHFGHLSVHEVLAAVLERAGWTPEHLAPVATGKREGWWGLPPGPEAFVEQLVTWRELSHVFAHHRPDDHMAWESLPDWARATLEHHAADRREHLYTTEDLAAARTHDPVWNAAQRQLLAEGRIHNQVRMLWGKKILEWTASPRESLAVMLDLNDRWALDGRDPSSTAGILWVLGRHDRAWGPERPVFGKVRFMSSKAQQRKLRLREWLARWSG